MRCYGYALLDQPAPLDDLRGVDGERLEQETSGVATLVFGRVDATPAVSRDALIAQDRVVRTLHARAASVLPLRFGTSFADVAAADARMREQDARLVEALAMVRDRAQMTLRFVRVQAAQPEPDEAAAAEPPLTGTAYLERRRHARAPVDPAIREFCAPLADLVVWGLVQATPRTPAVASAYHLVACVDVEAYADRVRERLDAAPALRVRLAGPSPAYAFASSVSL